MEVKCQKSAIQQLKNFADRNVHGIVIEGPEGCGKTFIVKEFARFVNISDVIYVAPKVSELKQMMNTCINLKTPVILCIENLDTGVPAAAYSLLKFLEEPLDTVYTIVTCRNIENIPDTIVSRCPVATVSTPNSIDINNYAKLRNPTSFDNLCETTLWRCAKTFKDADMILGFNHNELLYFQSIDSMTQFKDTVSNLMWQLGHYADNSEAPTLLVLRYIVEIAPTSHIKHAAMQCIEDLSRSRIASHAVLAKFIFECKYCE